MSASWYDVLGVEPDATTDEIRTVWKSAIADLDPTDRRFRACNQAAEVLLDPQRRAAYDAELAAEEPEDEATEPLAEVAAVHVPETAGDQPVSGVRGLVVPGWLLGALALWVLIAVGAATWVQFFYDAPEEIAAKVSEARTQAEKAMPKLYSYNWKTAEADRDLALRQTTGPLRTQLEQLWDEAILPNVDKVKGHAESTTVASGIVGSSSDGDQVQILIFLDSTSGNVSGTNHIRLAFTVTMTEVAGHWLVSNLEGANPAAGGGSTPSPSGTPSSTPSQTPSPTSSPTG